jgi:predicted Zn-dependent peptidase
MNIEHQLYDINGYKVLLLQTNNENISVKSLIDTGYIHEEEDNLGINHLIEHALVNGNPHCNDTSSNKPNYDCITHMNKSGIMMNATTGLNIVTYYTLGIKSDLQKMLSFIIETTINPENINDHVVEKEKKAVIDELLQNSNNSDINMYFTLFQKFYSYYGLNNFFNYKKQIDNLKHLNANKLKAFYKKHYTNIIFVVSGKFNSEEKQNLLNLFRRSLSSRNINQRENYSQQLTKPSHCFRFKKEAYYLNNPNLKNTTIMLAFPSLIENNNYNAILLTFITKYVQNLGMHKLRSQEKLIYGLKVEPSMNYCGTSMIVVLNSTNENARKTLDKFVEMIKESFSYINKEFIDGIKKSYVYGTNKHDVNDSIAYYENLYINKFFNRCGDKICDIDEHTNNLMNVKESEVIKLMKVVFNLDKMLVVYSSSKSMA